MQRTNATPFVLPTTTLYCSCYPVAAVRYVGRAVDLDAGTVRCDGCGVTWELAALYAAEVRRGRGWWSSLTPATDKGALS